MKRDISEVMKRLRPLLVQGEVDLSEFDSLETSIAFGPPENDRMYWGLLCEFLEISCPPPTPEAPAWVREVSDIITGKK